MWRPLGEKETPPGENKTPLGEKETPLGEKVTIIFDAFLALAALISSRGGRWRRWRRGSIAGSQAGHDGSDVARRGEGRGRLWADE